MKKISSSVLCKAGLHQLSIIALTFLCTISAFAKNNCDTNVSRNNPALAAHSGIGGTGAAQSGIGGTGLHDGGTGGTGRPEGGIGGTGNTVDDGGIGGTGILGTITGFASICVNGIELHYNDNTAISVDGQLTTARELAVGQVVAARALGTGNELTARNIAVIHATVGPIGNFDIGKGEMQVLGQTVRIGQVDRGNFAHLKTGDWVQVSGHRLSSGAIAASRIDAIPSREKVSLNGHITKIDPQGFEVNGARIQPEGKLLPAGLTQGMEVSIAGHWDGVQLKAHQVQTEPTRQNIGNVNHVVIEGYIHALDGKELNLSNRIVTLDSGSTIGGDTKNDLRLDQRIQISGRTGTDQRISVDRIELKQEVPVQLQIQQETGRDGSDSGGHDRKDNSHNKSEAKSIHSGESNQSQNSGRHTNGKEESGKDSGNHSDENKLVGNDGGEKPQDHHRPQDSSDQRVADKPEKLAEPDRPERSGDHRDTLRDIDTLDRDNIRDHSGHHDRDFSHRDRDFDR